MHVKLYTHRLAVTHGQRAQQGQNQGPVWAVVLDQAHLLVTLGITKRWLRFWLDKSHHAPKRKGPSVTLPGFSSSNREGETSDMSSRTYMGKHRSTFHSFLARTMSKDTKQVKSMSRKSTDEYDSPSEARTNGHQTLALTDTIPFYHLPLKPWMLLHVDYGNSLPYCVSQRSNDDQS